MQRHLDVVHFISAVPASSSHGLLPRLNRAVFLACTSLLPLSAMAAAQDPNVAQPVEPLSVLYLISVGLVFVAIFAGFYMYYMRGNEDDDKPDPK